MGWILREDRDHTDQEANYGFEKKSQILKMTMQEKNLEHGHFFISIQVKAQWTFILLYLS
ncbi:MAG: hypothetical protein PHS82_01765 [Lachnospiraceae bacterium]|nr:hypothetical protein [Lachnospiraceae bacterium]